MTIEMVAKKIVEISKQHNLTIKQAVRLTVAITNMLPNIILK